MRGTYLVVGVNELSSQAHVEHRLIQAVEHRLCHLAVEKKSAKRGTVIGQSMVGRLVA